MSCKSFLYWDFDEMAVDAGALSFLASYSAEAWEAACSTFAGSWFSATLSCFVDSQETKIMADKTSEIGNTFYIFFHPKMIVVT